MERGFPGFGMGTILAIFKIVGMSEWEIEWLNKAVRKRNARGPRALRWTVVKPSGPTAVDDLAFLIASTTIESER